MEPLDAQDAVERARALAAAGGRRLLGITGPPGAGKSTVAEQVVAALGDQRNAGLVAAYRDRADVLVAGPNRPVP